MNVLQLCDKSSARVKASHILETFAKASPSHSATGHNFYNNSNNNRFIGTRTTDNTSRIIRVEMMKNARGFLR